MTYLHSRAVVGQPVPEVGMGATVLHWTDRSPATVVEVFKIGKAVAFTVQEDRATRIDQNGMRDEPDRLLLAEPGGWQEHVQAARGRPLDRRVAEPADEPLEQQCRRGRPAGVRGKYHDFSF